MRRIEYTNAFRRDFKREKKGHHAVTLTLSFLTWWRYSLRITFFSERTAIMPCPANGTTIANVT